MSIPRDLTAGPSGGRWPGMAGAARLGARLALITALTWASWCSALTFSALLSGPRAAARPRVEVLEALVDPSAALDTLRVGGTWSFAGLPHSIAISRGDGDRLVARLALQAGSGAVPPVSDLVPLPGSARRLGWHRDHAGRLTAELVSVVMPRGMLLTSWSRQGWTVFGPLGGQADGPRLVRCRDGRTVHVWFHDTAEAGATTLLLVRPSPPAETSRTP